MVVAALFVGCTTEDVTDTPQMTDIGDIEVTFSIDGEEVHALDLPSVSHKIVVDVKLNNDGVYWKPVSDQSWCQIVEEEHRGSGSFTIVINANNSFDARQEAEITFVAGEYEVPKLRVAHDGNVFVINQVYAASTKAAGSATTIVKTLEGVEWSIECDEWLTATKTTSTTTDGMTSTEIAITWTENSSESRYGEVRLTKDGRTNPEGWFNVWQYGTELNYDTEGNLLLGAKDASPLELRVPRQTIKDVEMPSWVTYELVDNGDTMSYLLQFADNPSDAQHIRVTELELSMLSGAANIALPVIMQEYYAMEGLLTGPGLALFAKTWNEGGDVSQWYINGVPTIVEDMDLTEIKEWISIGTPERPWTGEFNGNGKKLINFKSSKPLFGVVENATLKNIIFDETSTISLTGEYNSVLYLAPLAAEIKSTTVENCTNYGTISLDAASKAAANDSYVAGLVGKADATSVVKLCNNFGTISIPTSCTTTSGSTFHIGGMVAYNEGSIEDSFNTGTIIASALVATSHVGGIAGFNAEGAILRNNLNAGNITYGSPRGSEVGTGYIGGISGMGNGEITGNTNEGDVTSTSKVQSIYAGGITSYIDNSAIILTNNSQENASDVKIGEGNLYVYAGGIVGYIGDEVQSLTFDFVGEEINLAGSVYAGNGEAQATAEISAGALVGHTDAPITINNAHYDGTVTCDLTNTTTGNYYSFGGLVGRATVPITINSSSCVGKVDIAAKAITKAKLTFGGIVGLAEAGVTISNCSSSMDIKYSAATPSKSNGYPSHMGGIVGRILMGKSSIENCTNQGSLYNRLYNNNLYHDLEGVSSDGKMNMAAGILGSYGYLSTLGSGDTITIKNCTNANHINAYRGGVAGIVGYIYNGLVDGCTFTTGNLADSTNSYAGGIAAIAYNSTVSNCTVISTIKSSAAGSLYIRQGGIVAWARGNTTVSGCSYYGAVSYSASATDDFSGGIVGLAQDDEIVVENCRYGGTVNSVAITASNCGEYAIGKASLGGWESNPTVTGIELWNGK